MCKCIRDDCRVLNFWYLIPAQTGGDGCICYLEYDRDRRSLEFIGMKQVKELSLIQSVSADNNSPDDLAKHSYAVGFASTDFIIWNLTTEAKVIACSLSLSPLLFLPTTG